MLAFILILICSLVTPLKSEAFINAKNGATNQNGATNGAVSQVKGITSIDPNDIVGPAGYGPQAFISQSATDAYTINFENAAAATAPAQKIVIIQQLDANLDWRTFRLTGFAFDSLTTTLSGNQAFYSGLLDYSATKGFDVQVTAGVNVVTGVVTWTIQTIDPATGQPPTNPELGLLPPDDAEGDGEGFVSYTIQPKAGLQTGDTVTAQATVIFDTNAPINTPAIVNTIDAVAPTSAVEALPAVEASPSFEVSWSGTDDPTGSGIANYTIEVSEDGAAPTQWLVDTTRTNAIFTGDPGHSYAFWSSATDNAGNVQLLNAAPDTETQIACFMAGTRIATEHGDVAVELLRVGDHVWALAAGHAMPIKWTGHRRVDCERRPEPKQVWPVRVLAGAFSPGAPSRDLWLSPDHAVFVDGVSDSHQAAYKRNNGRSDRDAGGDVFPHRTGAARHTYGGGPAGRELSGHGQPDDVRECRISHGLASGLFWGRACAPQ